MEVNDALIHVVNPLGDLGDSWRGIYDKALELVRLEEVDAN